MTTRMDAPRSDRGGAGLGDEDGLDRDGDDRRGGKGRGAGQRRKLLSDEIVAKIDYKNPQILRSFVTDRGKMIPRRISGASARQQRVISTALRRARMLALLPFSVTGD
ncbi:MAG: 30S ribosomal protein S18 [Kofleriaceae bacterium]